MICMADQMGVRLAGGAGRATRTVKGTEKNAVRFLVGWASEE